MCTTSCWPTKKCPRPQISQLIIGKLLILHHFHLAMGTYFDGTYLYFVGFNYNIKKNPCQILLVLPDNYILKIEANTIDIMLDFSLAFVFCFCTISVSFIHPLTTFICITFEKHFFFITSNQ